MYGIYINLGCRFENAMKEFRAIFPIYRHRVRVCEKRSFLNISCIQNVWGRFEFTTTLWKNFRQFFRFHWFWSSGPRMQKKVSFSILAVFQNVWDLHKFELQIWIQNAKITLWKNFGQFFRFHQFWSSGPRMRKKVSFQY